MALYINQENRPLFPLKATGVEAKPTYLILVASDELRHADFVYELNHVPLGTPFEWCSAEEAVVTLHSRSHEKPGFACQLRYVTD